MNKTYNKLMEQALIAADELGTNVLRMTVVGASSMGGFTMAEVLVEGFKPDQNKNSENVVQTIHCKIKEEMN